MKPSCFLQILQNFIYWILRCLLKNKTWSGTLRSAVIPQSTYYMTVSKFLPLNKIVSASNGNKSLVYLMRVSTAATLSPRSSLLRTASFSSSQLLTRRWCCFRDCSWLPAREIWEMRFHLRNCVSVCWSISSPRYLELLPIPWFLVLNPYVFF